MTEPSPPPNETTPAGSRTARNGAAPFTAWARRYGYVGALLGLGSPLGLLALRYYVLHRGLIHSWIAWELRVYGWHYIYAAIGTVLAMAAWGLWAGRRLDDQRGRAELLERAAGRLRHLAATDGLTGVYVRRHLLEKLEEELRRAERYKTPIASLFVDVDNFKHFNETHGHIFGDEVLRQIARVIQKSVRESDVVGRYGGDEFLVMLPHARAREAMLAAERVRQGVEALSIPKEGGPAVGVTVSVGVIAEIPHRADVLRFLDIADQALRRSKGLGKNCTILCDTPASDTPHSPEET
ncbi:MAG TPA: GGDEF domain-containing protein [Elusimicrobiota bacterium]|nr:GGDEF domain-containing protein [Elusimicrobiota bacterium]HNG45212.1 GGDEF domain-containing protein [Elusimicrobiota bacterium]